MKMLGAAGSVTSHDGVLVRPGRPARRVVVSDEVFTRLQAAQAVVAPRGIRLLLVRGFEAGSPLVRFVRRRMRALGSRLFRWLYPTRASEVRGIFGANGHDDPAANAVDVAIVLDGRRLKLLPHGVFTPPRLVEANYRSHEATISLVHEALRSVGLAVHPNAVEALQVHCALPAEDAARRGNAD
ncbi:hypothetical protein ACIBG8_04580 [Nonomuraea sp. NPDC050556]|uniref:hypothetical protein n=1 Tax=Nonomuraea sp. NPDC050556 TaxID=3364369 RepID=UPI0037B3C7C0